MVYTIRNIREVPDEQPNPSAAELGATEQQYMLGETCLTKVRNRELCDVTVKTNNAGTSGLSSGTNH